MQLKIVNKTGRGYDTEIFVMDGDEEIGKLMCVRSINFDLFNGNSLITASLDCYIKNVELIATPKKENISFLQYIYNNQEMKRLGLGRIN